MARLVGHAAVVAVVVTAAARAWVGDGVVVTLAGTVEVVIALGLGVMGGSVPLVAGAVGRSDGPATAGGRASRPPQLATESTTTAIATLTGADRRLLLRHMGETCLPSSGWRRGTPPSYRAVPGQISLGRAVASVAGALLAVAVVTGCAQSAARPSANRATVATWAAPTSGVSPLSAAPTPSSTGPVRPGTTAARPPTTTAPAAAAGLPVFVGTVSPTTAAELPYSYRPGCPVGPDQLRRLALSYWGFDHVPHVGALVVNAAVTQDAIKIFATLFAERFPIHQIQPVDAYGGSDPASMAADNTSGFNCRLAVAPGPPQWSAHAYGKAIDVNTVENPYSQGGLVRPAAGRAYLDRAVLRPGMAVPGGQLVEAFASVGWFWGGRWTANPDYQHFSKTGG